MKHAINLLSIVVLLTAASAIHAEECTVSAPPTCVQGCGNFDNKEAEQTCRDQVKTYQKSANAFWDCQREQTSAVNKDACNVVRLSNYRIHGKETCE